MMRAKMVDPKDLIAFMEVKQIEIENIITKHIEQDPQQIARAIVEELEYHNLPISLLVRRSYGKSDKK